MAANIPNPTNRREYRYNRFFQIVDQVVQEIQDGVVAEPRLRSQLPLSPAVSSHANNLGGAED
ncbi:hypothetical protein [Limimaricola litoreus]|uniref:Uncharacterized protein n=1 Tax=Limimaricola litoreus TaxID=2955316 RepID=A0A9X2FQE4_9RHOB|nr:hypothetical protein [Limimaricola litoreus]MCP1168485.1 hypothetical protein [Limimaricola litoreus]